MVHRFALFLLPKGFVPCGARSPATPSSRRLQTWGLHHLIGKGGWVYFGVFDSREALHGSRSYWQRTSREKGAYQFVSDGRQFVLVVGLCGLDRLVELVEEEGVAHQRMLRVVVT